MFLVNINAMVVNGSNHKEQTKTELNCEDAIVSLSDADVVYLNMEKEKSFFNRVDFGSENDVNVFHDMSYKTINETFKDNFYNFISNKIKVNPDNHLDILKSVDSWSFKNEMFGNFDNQKNVLDKILDQTPDALKNAENKSDLEFVLNKTEFNKIENLLDKNNCYKGYKVRTIHNYPDKFISLKRIEKSKYF